MSLAPRLTKLAIAAVIALTATPVHAQATCAARDTVVAKLQMDYGESLTGGGLQSARQVMEVWAAPDTGTWTLLMTRADGIACVIASGTNWHQQRPESVVMGVPS